jgi:hypothetical protein
MRKATETSVTPKNWAIHLPSHEFGYRPEEQDLMIVPREYIKGTWYVYSNGFAQPWLVFSEEQKEFFSDYIEYKDTDPKFLKDKYDFDILNQDKLQIRIKKKDSVKVNVKFLVFDFEKNKEVAKKVIK